MTDILIVIVLLLIAGGAGFYIYRVKKSGAHCVGCPHSKTCGQKNCSCTKPQDDTKE